VRRFQHISQRSLAGVWHSAQLLSNSQLKRRTAIVICSTPCRNFTRGCCTSLLPSFFTVCLRSVASSGILLSLSAVRSSADAAEWLQLAQPAFVVSSPLLIALLLLFSDASFAPLYPSLSPCIILLPTSALLVSPRGSCLTSPFRLHYLNVTGELRLVADGSDSSTPDSSPAGIDVRSQFSSLQAQIDSHQATAQQQALLISQLQTTLIDVQSLLQQQATVISELRRNATLAQSATVPSSCPLSQRFRCHSFE
jgi:hypothetical protein